MMFFGTMTDITSHKTVLRETSLLTTYGSDITSHQTVHNRNDSCFEYTLKTTFEAAVAAQMMFFGIMTDITSYKTVQPHRQLHYLFGKYKGSRT